MTFIFISSLFCFIAIAYGGPIESESAKVYPESCAKGQIAWCSNFKSAAECDALGHCIQNVWLNTKTIDEEDSCPDCVAIIDDFRRDVDSNTTKEALKEALEAICDLSIWMVPFHKFCVQLLDTYVDEYFNELLDLLRSDVDSRTICRILFFCGTSSMSSEVNQDEALIMYKNIVLHLPARFIDAPEIPKLLGNEKCTWGPSYWCDNISSSKECKMTSHCIESVWSKTTYDDDNDSVCKICKDMVKQASDQLQSNETQEELKEVFEGSCKLIPIKDIRAECIKLADEFVPELTEMLVQQLNPTAICTVAGLCNSARIDKLLAATSSAASAPAVPDSCTNCTIAFTAVERFLANSPADDVLEKLLSVCGLLSSYSDACAKLVKSHFEEWYAVMKRDLKPFAACHLSGMCAYKYHFHPSPEDVAFRAEVDTALATANDDLPCDLCKQLVKHFKDVLVQNTTEEEFLQVLRGICTETGNFKTECLKLVNDRFEEFYKFLTEELNPSEVCREVKLCPEGRTLTDDSLNLIFGRNVPHTFASTNQIASLVPAESPPSDVECDFCKTVIQLIQRELKDPKFEGDVEKAIDEVCTLVPSSDKAECDKFVEEYASDLMKMVADETDPKVICGMLGLCRYARRKALAAGGELCPFCQYLMHYVQVELDDPNVEKDIEKTVENVCRYLPTAEQSSCKQFINQYSALIIAVLAQELDPTLVCPALKLCPSLLSADDRCGYCQTLMDEFIVQLGDNRLESNIKTKLERFVAADRNKANKATLVAVELKFSHYEDIVDMMTAEFDGQESCTYLQFCNAETISSVSRNEITWSGSPVREASALGKPSCEICEIFVRMYEDKLTSNVTEHELEIAFLKYCDKITNVEIKSNCSRLVDRYLPRLMELLRRDVKPKDLCGLAKLCPLEAANTFGLKSMPECRVCEVVVGALQSLNADPLVESATLAQVEKVCELISVKERDTCSMIVNALAPQILSVVDGIPSWYYCAKLHMCPYGEHLIDPAVCSRPESQCEDLKTAVVCDKLKHCQQNVWKSEKPTRN